ncbi:unnamed protein product [Prunus armeniaca]
MGWLEQVSGSLTKASSGSVMKKIEAWVALVDFQQLDESFVRFLGCLTKEKMGRDGGIWLEIEVFQG